MGQGFLSLRARQARGVTLAPTAAAGASTGAYTPVGRGWGKAVHPRTTHYPENLNHKTAFCVLAGGACACTFFFSSATGVQDFCFSSATGVWDLVFFMPSSGGARFLSSPGNLSQLSACSPVGCRCRCLHWRMHACTPQTNMHMYTLIVV